MTAGRCAVFDKRDGEEGIVCQCSTCGTVFDVPTGGLIECPTCAAIADAPKLKACPHCGGSTYLDVAWEGGMVKKGRHFESRRVFRAICQTCGCQTRGCNYADDAATSWNDRVKEESE